MMSLCLRYTGNEPDAMEALNSGFLKVFTHIGRYKAEQSQLYTWIRTIIINTCLDLIKARQRSRQTFQSLETSQEVHLNADVFSKIKADDLLALIRQLPPATRAVFNLYVIEGYNHREIGELLNISEGTSKWHLSEARKSLQQKVQALGVMHYE